jgi:hypothetical protein
MAGGGVYGKAVGIVHIITTAAGVIMAMSQVFIMMLTRGGEDTTKNAIGTDTAGTTGASRTGSFNRTGKAGIIIDTGNGEEPGAYRTISPDHYIRDRI